MSNNIISLKQAEDNKFNEKVKDKSEFFLDQKEKLHEKTFEFLEKNKKKVLDRAPCPKDDGEYEYYCFSCSQFRMCRECYKKCHKGHSNKKKVYNLIKSDFKEEKDCVCHNDLVDKHLILFGKDLVEAKENNEKEDNQTKSKEEKEKKKVKTENILTFIAIVKQLRNINYTSIEFLNTQNINNFEEDKNNLNEELNENKNENKNKNKHNKNKIEPDDKKQNDSIENNNSISNTTNQLTHNADKEKRKEKIDIIHLFYKYTKKIIEDNEAEEEDDDNFFQPYNFLNNFYRYIAYLKVVERELMKNVFKYLRRIPDKDFKLNQTFNILWQQEIINKQINKLKKDKKYFNYLNEEKNEDEFDVKNINETQIGILMINLTDIMIIINFQHFDNLIKKLKEELDMNMIDETYYKKVSLELDLLRDELFIPTLSILNLFAEHGLINLHVIDKILSILDDLSANSFKKADKEYNIYKVYEEHMKKLEEIKKREDEENKKRDEEIKNKENKNNANIDTSSNEKSENKTSSDNKIIKEAKRKIPSCSYLTACLLYKCIKLYNVFIYDENKNKDEEFKLLPMFLCKDNEDKQFKINCLLSFIDCTDIENDYESLRDILKMINDCFITPYNDYYQREISRGLYLYLDYDYKIGEGELTDICDEFTKSIYEIKFLEIEIFDDEENRDIRNIYDNLTSVSYKKYKKFVEESIAKEKFENPKIEKIEENYQKELDDFKKKLKKKNEKSEVIKRKVTLNFDSRDFDSLKMSIDKFHTLVNRNLETYELLISENENNFEKNLGEKKPILFFEGRNEVRKTTKSVPNGKKNNPELQKIIRNFLYSNIDQTVLLVLKLIIKKFSIYGTKKEEIKEMTQKCLNILSIYLLEEEGEKIFCQGLLEHFERLIFKGTYNPELKEIYNILYKFYYKNIKPEYKSDYQIDLNSSLIMKIYSIDALKVLNDAIEKNYEILLNLRNFDLEDYVNKICNEYKYYNGDKNSKDIREKGIEDKDLDDNVKQSELIKLAMNLSKNDDYFELLRFVSLNINYCKYNYEVKGEKESGDLIDEDEIDNKKNDKQKNILDNLLTGDEAFYISKYTDASYEKRAILLKSRLLILLYKYKLYYSTDIKEENDKKARFEERKFCNILEDYIKLLRIELKYRVGPCKKNYDNDKVYGELEKELKGNITKNLDEIKNNNSGKHDIREINYYFIKNLDTNYCKALLDCINYISNFIYTRKKVTNSTEYINLFMKLNKNLDLFEEKILNENTSKLEKKYKKLKNDNNYKELDKYLRTNNLILEVGYIDDRDSDDDNEELFEDEEDNHGVLQAIREKFKLGNDNKNKSTSNGNVIKNKKITEQWIKNTCKLLRIKFFDSESKKYKEYQLTSENIYQCFRDKMENFNGKIESQFSENLFNEFFENDENNQSYSDIQTRYPFINENYFTMPENSVFESIRNDKKKKQIKIYLQDLKKWIGDDSKYTYNLLFTENKKGKNLLKDYTKQIFLLLMVDQNIPLSFMLKVGVNSLSYLEITDLLVHTEIFSEQEKLEKQQKEFKKAEQEFKQMEIYNQKIIDDLNNEKKYYNSISNVSDVNFSKIKDYFVTLEKVYKDNQFIFNFKFDDVLRELQKKKKNQKDDKKDADLQYKEEIVDIISKKRNKIIDELKKKLNEKLEFTKTKMFKHKEDCKRYEDKEKRSNENTKYLDLIFDLLVKNLYTNIFLYLTVCKVYSNTRVENELAKKIICSIKFFQILMENFSTNFVHFIFLKDYNIKEYFSDNENMKFYFGKFKELKSKSISQIKSQLCDYIKTKFDLDKKYAEIESKLEGLTTDEETLLKNLDEIKKYKKIFQIELNDNKKLMKNKDVHDVYKKAVADLMKGYRDNIKEYIESKIIRDQKPPKYKNAKDCLEPKVMNTNNDILKKIESLGNNKIEKQLKKINGEYKSFYNDKDYLFHQFLEKNLIFERVKEIVDKYVQKKIIDATKPKEREDIEKTKLKFDEYLKELGKKISDLIENLEKNKDKTHFISLKIEEFKNLYEIENKEINPIYENEEKVDKNDYPLKNAKNVSLMIVGNYVNYNRYYNPNYFQFENILEKGKLIELVLSFFKVCEGTLERRTTTGNEKILLAPDSNMSIISSSITDFLTECSSTFSIYVQKIINNFITIYYLDGIKENIINFQYKYSTSFIDTNKKISVLGNIKFFDFIGTLALTTNLSLFSIFKSNYLLDINAYPFDIEDIGVEYFNIIKDYFKVILVNCYDKEDQIEYCSCKCCRKSSDKEFQLCCIFESCYCEGCYKCCKKCKNCRGMWCCCRSKLNNLVKLMLYQNDINAIDFRDYLFKLYIQSKNFRKNKELELIFKIFIFIKILETKWSFDGLSKLYEEVAEYENENELQNKDSVKWTKAFKNCCVDIKDFLSCDKCNIKLNRYYVDLEEEIQKNENNEDKQNKNNRSNQNDDYSSNHNNNNEKKKKKDVNEEPDIFDDIYNSYCHGLYLFLNKICSFVEFVFTVPEENVDKVNQTRAFKDFDYDDSDETDKDNITSLFTNNYNNTFNKFEYKNKFQKIDKSDLHKVIETNMNIDENENEDNDEEKKEDESKNYTYFVVPFECYLVSENTKNFIFNTMDTTSHDSKILSLVQGVNYYLFEIYSKGNEQKKLTNIYLLVQEIIIDLLIFAVNIIALYSYYEGADSGFRDKEKKQNIDGAKTLTEWPVIILSAVIGIYCLVIIILYLIFDFKYELFRNLLLTYCKNSLIFGDKNFETQINVNAVMEIYDALIQLKSDEKDVEKLKNKTVRFPLFRKIFNRYERISQFRIFFNIIFGIFYPFKYNIAIFVWILILNILYLIFYHPFILALELLFAANQIASVKAILKGILSKGVTLIWLFYYLLVIIFVFMWAGNSFFKKYLAEYEVVDRNGKAISESENGCSYSTECMLHYFSTGLFDSSTSDLINPISFEQNYEPFIGLFFYNIISFIILNLIFSNIYTGLIGNVFDEQREKEEQKEYELSQKCLICDMNKEKCENSGHSFKMHVEDEHDIYKYFYFLVYLFNKNKDDYNILEKSIWEQIKNNDISWAPYYGEESDD